MSTSKWNPPPTSSKVLGDCVTCGGQAIAYSGATTNAEGNYLCVGCTTNLKASTKLKKAAPSRNGRMVRRDHPEPPPVEGARWLQLGTNRLALVDAGDFKRASVKNWFLFGGFAVRREQWGGKLRHDYLHHFVLGLDADPEKKSDRVVEFIDENPLNCRRANLRVTQRAAHGHGRARD